MARKPIKAICESCSQPFDAKPKKDWLGFHKVKCPHCSHRGLYPLIGGYRTIYGVLLGLVILWSIQEGTILMPGLIGMCAILGLVRDKRIRKEVAARHRADAAE
jgi:DNA-directed RNA polymerase subunit RPC12/RpoP